MTNPVVKPDVPYNGEIPGGLVPGRMCRIQGVSHPEADRFDINLQTGPSSAPRDDIALHLSVRHNQGYIARNSYKDGEWGDENGDGDLPIGHAQSWEILILVDEKDYKIAINGQHFTEFSHKIPFSEVKYLLIEGVVTITLISWEGIMGLAGQENASTASQVHSQEGIGGGLPPNAPPQGNYFPPQGYGGYGPAPGYGSGYGSAPGYGALPQGYGPPPPPGAELQGGGGGDWLNTAQNLLAGAIKIGAAEKLIRGFMSSGDNQPQNQGYAHNNAKYGIYPELPQDMNLNLTQNKPEPGPVEKLLSGLLSGGNPQAPGGGPQGQNQQVDISAFLSNLLSGKQQQTQIPPSQGAPQGAHQGGADIGTLLSSLLSGGNQSQVPPSHGVPQGGPNTQQGGAHTQQGGPDIGSLLSNLLSGGNQSQVPPSHGAPQGGPNTQQGGTHTQQGGAQTQQGTPDIGTLLSGLISGRNQSGSQKEPGAQNAQHGVDFNGLLSGLLSGNATRPIQETSTGKPVDPGSTHQQQVQGDFGSLLSGLLSGGSQQPHAGSTGQYPAPGNQQSQGIDLSGLLSGLLSSGGNQHTGGYHPAQPGGGYQPPSAGGYHPPSTGDSHPSSGTNRNQPPQNSSGNSNRSSKPAEQDFEDVSDQLAREIAGEGGGSRHQRREGGHVNEQYGYYPHAPQTQSQGPVESLLSGFLSGGNNQNRQQQPSGGGGGDVLGGLLSSFLHPRDNPRQNY